MNTWYTHHTQTVDGFEIVFSTCYESSDPSDHFDDDGETARKIEDGVYEWFVARVEARKAGVTLASDYLGACCYANVQDFYLESDGYYQDMVRTVIDEAKSCITKLAA